MEQRCNHFKLKTERKENNQVEKVQDQQVAFCCLRFQANKEDTEPGLSFLLLRLLAICLRIRSRSLLLVSNARLTTLLVIDLLLFFGLFDFIEVEAFCYVVLAGAGDFVKQLISVARKIMGDIDLNLVLVSPTTCSQQLE